MYTNAVRKNAAPPWMAYGFPAVATIVAFIAAHWRVLAGASPALYVLPVLVGVATFYGLRRVMTDKELPSTMHQYTVFGPRPDGGEPALRQLLDLLAATGYEPDAFTLDDEGRPGARPGHALDLVGAQLKIVDKRAADELGHITVRLRRSEDHGLTGLVVALDTGPGVYDEMAQFAMVALAKLYAGMEYVPAGKSDRLRAADLRTSLPDSPLGLALL
jgi:hypothetical protein